MTLEEKVWEYAQKNHPAITEAGTVYRYKSVEYIDRLAVPDGGFIYEVFLKATIKKPDESEEKYMYIATYLVENADGTIKEAKRERLYVSGNLISND